MSRIIFIAGFLFLFGSAGFAQTTGQTQSTDSSSKPLKILSRSKAVQTKTETKEKIEGVVRLRIVFKADGSIGEITDVTKKKREILEKHGMIEQAIEAAKKIKFTPARRNGQPITVIKTVEYVFTIY